MRQAARTAPEPARIRPVRVPRRLRRGPMPRSFARELAPAVLPAAPATDRLYQRLAPGATDAVRARLDVEQAVLWERAGVQERHWLTLAFGVHHEVPEVLEPTGLSPVTAPDEVHAMGRGPLAAGGAYYYADLVAEAAGAAGLQLGAGAGSTSAARRRAWCGCSRPPGRTTAGRAATPTRTPSRGRATTSRRSPSSPVRRRRPFPAGAGLRPRLRDLDLVALRARPGAGLARRDGAVAARAGCSC